MQLLRVGIVATFLLLLPGCALFVADAETDGVKKSALSGGFPWAKRRSVAIEELDENVPILKMVRLEASIVTRPANDPKIRRYVWEELDESGLMSPEVRTRLNDNGFRVGVAGSATPWAIQSLARDARVAYRSEDEQFSAQATTQTALGPSFSLMTNGKSLLEIQSQVDVQKIPLNQIEELATLRDREGLRCVFEVSIKEMNDDWVLLNVVPQIHAGASTARLSVSGVSEQLPVRQKVIPVYSQQFTVKLLAGEVAVIGRHESAAWNLGRLFFQPDTGSSASESLLMIRMAGVDKLRGQSDTSF